MSITPWLPTVRRIKDGETVEQATVNVPIDQLTQREQHLYEKFEELLGKSVLTSFGQPVHPKEKLSSGELSIVYFKSDTHGAGLAKGTTGFSSTSSSSMFSPNNSNYSFGLLKILYPQTNTADVYIEGLCELQTDIDDPVNGLIEKKADGFVEPFLVGPYYLSSRIPGKITRDPAGIPVYIGYAISKRKFLLHTNVDEFSQFFINYRYHILDRVAGVPKLNNNVWSITVNSFTNPPMFTGTTGTNTGVTITNTSTAYVGYPSTKVYEDTYTVNVTLGGSIANARFSISSEKLVFAEKQNVALTGALLFVDDSVGNNIILDFTGTTLFTAGASWTVAVFNYKNRLGWIPASAAQAIAPEGAVFYYNIPGPTVLLSANTQGYDEGLSSKEREETLDLAKYIPPIPENFIQLYVDGALVRYKDVYDTEGIYSVNEYGLWWHTAANGSQPWSASYPSGKDAYPDKWENIKNTLSASRKRIFVSFSKFNPALRTQLVSSLKPFNTLDNQSVNFIKFYNAEKISETAPTGDLIVDVNPQFVFKGFDDNASFVYPTTIDSENYTANRALAALKYVKSEGKFLAALTPIVAKLKGLGGIKVSEQPDAPGVWQISYLSEGATGQVDSIEPINARLEFRELTSYIKLPPPSTTPYGLIGKIVLPKGSVVNRAMNLVFHLFGDLPLDSNNLLRTVAFQFQYSAISALNSDSPTNYNIVDTIKRYPAINPVEFSIAAAGQSYTQFSMVKVANVNFSIPASFISEDTVINFKISRVAPAANSYGGNIGLVATYWEIPGV